jgi:translation elongation factor EF-4
MMIIDLLDVNRRYSCFRKTGFGVENILAAIIEKIPPSREY